MSMPAGRRRVGMDAIKFSVMAGLVPAISLRKAQCPPYRGLRDKRSFTPVFDGLCPVTTAMLLVLHHRRSVGVERLDRLQSPGLALLALFLGPGDRLPVGRKYQFRAGIRHFDAVAAGLVVVEEERLLHRVHVRAGLDEDAVLEEDVGGEQYLLARIQRVVDVMEAAVYAGVVARIG